MSKLHVITGVSNRHIHLSRADWEVLFGPSKEIEPLKPLRQPGQYATQQTVTLIGPKGSLQKVRVLCPLREQSQVELSVTDTYTLGLHPCFRQSGDLAGSQGLTVAGPCGTLELKEGAIVALRHLHMDPETAAQYGLRDQQYVCATVEGERAVCFEQVLVRVSDKFVPEFHVDTDEANGADLNTGDLVTIC